MTLAAFAKCSCKHGTWLIARGSKEGKIYVAGHRGMVGSSIVRGLKAAGYENIITRSHSELNLCRQSDVEEFFAAEKPDYVFLAAAKVGGIVANAEAPADYVCREIMGELSRVRCGRRQYDHQGYPESRPSHELS